MIICDFRIKQTKAIVPEAENNNNKNSQKETKAKTRKEIRKEKICQRCGLEAKKLFKPQMVSPAMRALGKIDWSTVSLNVIVILSLLLLVSLVIGSILKRSC